MAQGVCAKEDSLIPSSVLAESGSKSIISAQRHPFKLSVYKFTQISDRDLIQIG